MGASWREALPWFPERKRIEEKFLEKGLKNPLKGKSTHIIPSNQLDHILVPANAMTVDTSLVPTLFGSDHYPVALTTTLPALSV